MVAPLPLEEEESLATAKTDNSVVVTSWPEVEENLRSDSSRQDGPHEREPLRVDR